jgi:hypothetical protein
MKKEPAGRQTEYSVLRPDFFVISGLQNLKKFYLRAQLRGDEVRGFTSEIFLNEVDQVHLRPVRNLLTALADLVNA